MDQISRKNNSVDSNWHFAKSVTELQEAGASLVRINGRQLAVFNTSQGIRACDNRCPHEGFPLSQGTLSEECTLTCNWHNWKFNLETGENLFGGDSLRTYPTEIRGEEVWVDLTDPPYEVRRTTILNNLHDAFDDHAYDRIAREIARLIHLGGDPFDALRLAIDWSWQRMEFGWTHAYAGMADWLVLYDENPQDVELRLVCLQESVAHTAFDVLREAEYPYTDNVTDFDEEVFLNAIEAEDESCAIAAIRGGLRDGMKFEDFEPALTRAALAHYNDFGHSLIYVSKAGELINRLGSEVTRPLLLSLVRELVYATREDKIPEFRGYSTALANWNTENDKEPVAADWQQQGINRSLDLTVASSGISPMTIYNELLVANAVNLLSFNLSQQNKVRVTVSGNVGWLDFTHGLTFANAVRKQCARFPELWPQGLLQMACFNGRNAAFTTLDYNLENWRPENLEQGFKALIAQVLDHGQQEYIISVHWLKLALAVREEVSELPVRQGEILFAALNRFVNSPLKRRQARRTAYQSLQFVEKE
jgi:nitrite reductase/ring-hydroxylating ferredoxin subunit